MNTIDWSNEIGIIAGPMLSGDTRESWLSRAARKSGASFRQIKALYYRETTDPKTSVAYSILSAAEKARKEAFELAAKFEILAGGINATNENIHRDDVLALIYAARRLRGLDRT